ncbi:MAG: GGDEF domain-containing phosphodiesterase [Bacilli bacterium]|nr:GGDEF domain-containing phosphodiesterase [Bacilli bacterium]
MILRIASVFDDPHAYNYWLEVCALLFLVCLLIRSIADKKFVSKVNIIFGAAIVCGVLDVTLDIVAAVLVDHPDVVPERLNFFINGSFYFFQLCFPCLLYSFILYISAISVKTRRKMYLFFIPSGLYFLVLLSNPFTKLVFDIDYSLSNILVHGKLFMGLYIVTFFYVALTTITLILLNKKIEKQLQITMGFSLAFIVLMLVIQILFPRYLLTGVAISFSCWINYEQLSTGDLEDRVTGVFNYNAFVNYAKSEIDFSKHSNLIICHIGNITKINSTFGFLVGNHVYKEIGNYFNSLGNNFVFRISNSRFIIAFKEEEDMLRALLLIKSKFDHPWMVDGMEFGITVNGYYMKGNIDAQTTEDYIEFVTNLEYKIKRNNEEEDFILVDEATIKKISRDKTIEKALRKAIDNNYQGFEMHYQPIYEINKNKFNHSEALIRFTDPELGKINPAEFIPIAESCGLAQKIDRYVLNTTCAFLKNHPNVDFLDINISGAEFYHNPSKEFVEIVKKYGVNPKRLVIEVTETATIAYPDKLEKFMKDMIKEGFSFAIDDFGTGYSNISRILQTSFSIIKFDKTFLAENDTAEKILESMTSLLKNLKISIVIEGVETKEQYEHMKELGIEYIQGYYFSKPLNEKAYIKFINENEIKA